MSSKWAEKGGPGLVWVFCRIWKDMNVLFCDTKIWMNCQKVGRAGCPHVVKTRWERVGEVVAECGGFGSETDRSEGRGRYREGKSMRRMNGKKEHGDGAADRKGEDENEEPSDKVTDGNTHGLTACLYHSTESGLSLL